MLFALIAGLLLVRGAGFAAAGDLVVCLTATGAGLRVARLGRNKTTLCPFLMPAEEIKGFHSATFAAVKP